MTSGLKQFVRDVGWAFTNLAISSGAHLILRTFLARYYGTDELGLYTLTFIAYSFGMIFSTFGIGSALIKYVAERKENASHVNVLVTSGSTVALVSGCAVGVILFFFSSSIATHFFTMPELGNLLRIVAFAFPFIGLEKATLGFLNGLRRMRLFAFINIAQNVLTVILTVLLALWGYGLSGVVLAFVLPVILLSLFSLFSIRKSLAKPTLSQYGPAIKMLLRFGAYIVLAESIGAIPSYAGSILLGHFMTKADVGIYAVATLLAQAIGTPLQAVQVITTPMIASYWGKGKKDNIEYLVNRIMKYVAAFLVPVCFLVGFLGREIITLIFGTEFVLAYLAMQILLIGAIFGAILISVGGALASTAYVNMIFKIEGITVAANIALNLLLVPRLGTTGAAIATSSSTIIGVSLNLCFMQHLIGIRIDWGWFARLFTFTVLLAGATYLLGLVVNHYISISVTAIILILVLLKYFLTREDLTLIRRAIS